MRMIRRIWDYTSFDELWIADTFVRREVETAWKYRVFEGRVVNFPLS